MRLNFVTSSLLSLSFAVIANAKDTQNTRLPLPNLGADRSSLTVSGLSSGGAMAIQYGVAFASKVKGVGVIAAPPYFCAKNNLMTAMGECMKGEPDVQSLYQSALVHQAQDGIDDFSYLSKQLIWLFSGKKDTTVLPSVMNTTAQFYQGVTPENQIKYVNFLPAGHAFVTENFGHTCQETKSPFINNCGYDSAKEMLSWFYGPLNDYKQGAIKEPELFDQRPYLESSAGLDDYGYVFIPKACRFNPGCKVHVAFHGCNQSRDKISAIFASNTELNLWADTNNIIVLYPQVKQTEANPFSCWDWWGYTGSDYSVKSGPQLKSVNKMIESLFLNVDNIE
ncbi:PHB depolymerase family esterase [Vibrio caribbeanicus]|uniref:extracellular catalytic domain type 2 short-chain-length polyhydroxyalkanoate depolymerase n=1 Tax=Vibrio caribbeanicus TaxID=701175 RepID=UPI0030DD9EFF